MSNCPAGNFSALTITDCLFLDVGLLGGQQVFVDKNGALGFTQVHEHTIPDSASTAGFTVMPPSELNTPGRLNGPVTFYACPASATGQSEIFVGITGVDTTACSDIAIGTDTSDGVGAWQYQ